MEWDSSLVLFLSVVFSAPRAEPQFYDYQQYGLQGRDNRKRGLWECEKHCMETFSNDRGLQNSCLGDCRRRFGGNPEGKVK
ncbi:UNVERIFIED_CONTAM: hypothetical protein RMT77_014606 [Armadillidium vulgare]